MWFVDSYLCWWNIPQICVHTSGKLQPRSLRCVPWHWRWRWVLKRICLVKTFGRQENCIWALLSISYQTRLVVAVVDFFANTSNVTRCVSAVVDFLASISDFTHCVSAVVEFLAITSDGNRCAVMTSYGTFPTSSIALWTLPEILQESLKRKLWLWRRKTKAVGWFEFIDYFILQRKLI